MEKIFLFIMYLLTTMVAVLVSLRLLGFTNIGYKGIIIGLANGFNDFLVREVFVGKAHFFNGFHFITGTILVFILSYFLLGVRKRVALTIPVLAYIICAVSEVMMLLLLISLFGKPLFNKILTDVYVQMLGGLIFQLPVFIMLFLLHMRFKDVKLTNLSDFK